MRKSLKSLSLWSLVTIALVFGTAVAGDFFSFPLGLALLRVAFLVAEQVWPRLQAEIEQPTLKLS